MDKTNILQILSSFNGSRSTVFPGHTLTVGPSSESELDIALVCDNTGGVLRYTLFIEDAPLRDGEVAPPANPTVDELLESLRDKVSSGDMPTDPLPPEVLKALLGVSL